jgi:tRNA(fMet)-specific endonuclease VapC
METRELVIDTNIFIEYLRAKNKRNTILFSLPDSARLFISAVTLYELFMGATTDEKKNDVLLLTEYATILPFTTDVALKASEIYHELRKTNNAIEFRDIFIGATCLVYDLPLVTVNKKHFTRIRDLRFS